MTLYKRFVIYAATKEDAEKITQLQQTLIGHRNSPSKKHWYRFDLNEMDLGCIGGPNLPYFYETDYRSGSYHVDHIYHSYEEYLADNNKPVVKDNYEII